MLFQRPYETPSNHFTMKETSSPCTGQLSDHQFDHFAASQSLAACRHSLETLHLDLRARIFFPCTFRSASSLADFTALRSLVVDSMFVCIRRDDPCASSQRLVEMLPPNLVSLELVRCPGDAAPVFAKMFLALQQTIREGRFQALERIKYHAGSVPVSFTDTYFDDLLMAERFAELGVELTCDPPDLDYSEFAKAVDRLWDRGRIDYGTLLNISDCAEYPGALPMPTPGSDEDDDL